jgi:hypothetical protein
MLSTYVVFLVTGMVLLAVPGAAVLHALAAGTVADRLRGSPTAREREVDLVLLHPQPLEFAHSVDS